MSVVLARKNSEGSGGQNFWPFLSQFLTSFLGRFFDFRWWFALIGSNLKPQSGVVQSKPEFFLRFNRLYLKFNNFFFELFLKIESFYSALSTEHELYFSLSEKILCLTQDADFVISFSGVLERPNNQMCFWWKIFRQVSTKAKVR